MYTPIIVDHFSNPRCVGEMKNPPLAFEVGNSVCGDRIFVNLALDEQGVVSDIRFKAYGCATSIATGSLFCDAVLNRRLDDTLAMGKHEQRALLGELEPSQIHCRDLLEQLFVKLGETCSLEDRDESFSIF